MFPGSDSGSPGRSRDTTVPESGVCSQEEIVVVRVVVETLLHLRAEYVPRERKWKSGL